MKLTSTIKLMAMLAMTILSTSAMAQKIPFQGKLLENGTPVDGTREMVFSIDVDGTQWTESYVGAEAVQVTNGLYAVVLGSKTPLPEDIFFGVDSRQLIVAVGGQVLSPVELYAPIVKELNSFEYNTTADGENADGLIINQNVDPDYENVVTGVRILVTGDGTTTGDINGIRSTANGNNRLYNAGVWGEAFGNGNTSPNSENYGLYGDARNNQNNNYGVFGRGIGGTKSFGVYGTASGASQENWAGWFQGDVKITGQLDIEGGLPNFSVNSLNVKSEIDDSDRLEINLDNQEDAAFLRAFDKNGEISLEMTNTAVFATDQSGNPVGNELGKEGNLRLSNSANPNETRINSTGIFFQGFDEEANAYIGYNWADGGPDFFTQSTRGALFLWGDVATRDLLNGQDIRRVDLKVADDGTGKDIGQLQLRGPWEGDNRLVDAGGYIDDNDNYKGYISLLGSDGSEFTITSDGLETTLPDTVKRNFNTGDPQGTTFAVVAEGEGGNDNVAFSAVARAADGFNTGIWGKANGNATNTNPQYGVYGEATSDGNDGFVQGTTGVAGGTGTGARYGLRGDVSGTNSGFTVAVRGLNNADAVVDGGNFGGNFDTRGNGVTGVRNVGVSGRAFKNAGQNIGLYGSASDGDENWAGWFDGDVQINGNQIGLGKKNWEPTPERPYFSLRSTSDVEDTNNADCDDPNTQEIEYCRYFPDMIWMEVTDDGQGNEMGAISLRSSDGKDFRLDANGISGDISVNKADNEFRVESDGNGRVFLSANNDNGTRWGRISVNSPSDLDNIFLDYKTWETDPNLPYFRMNGSQELVGDPCDHDGDPNTPDQPCNYRPDLIWMNVAQWEDQGNPTEQVGEIRLRSTSGADFGINAYGFTGSLGDTQFANDKISLRTGSREVFDQNGGTGEFYDIAEIAVGNDAWNNGIILSDDAGGEILLRSNDANGVRLNGDEGAGYFSGDVSAFNNGIVLNSSTRDVLDQNGDPTGDTYEVAQINVGGDSWNNGVVISDDAGGELMLNSNGNLRIRLEGDGGSGYFAGSLTARNNFNLGGGTLDNDQAFMRVDTDGTDDWGVLRLESNFGDFAELDGTGSLNVSQNISVGTSRIDLNNAYFTTNISSGDYTSLNSTIGDGSPNTNNGGQLSLSGISETSGIRMYGEFLDGDQNPVSHIALDDNSGSYIYLWGRGDISASGNISSPNITALSDRNLKENIFPLNKSLEKVLQLRGVSYDWKDDKYGAEKEIGVIAQEVEEIYPEFVHTNDEGMKSVNYAQMVAVLIESIKELNAKIVTLETENASLKSSLAEVEGLKSQMKNLESLVAKLVNNDNVASSQQ